MLAVIGFIAIVLFILKLVIENIRLKAEIGFLKIILGVIIFIIILAIIF